MNDALTTAVWVRLLKGEQLDGLPLGERDGRIDLHGLSAPGPTVLRTLENAGDRMSLLDLKSVGSNVRWRHLDFTGARLNGLRLTNVVAEDCVFDDCEMRDLRMWACCIRKTSFKRVNLREAALGTVLDERLNSFSDVDFSGADLRGSVYKACSFTDCDFSGARLENLDFQSSAFVRCRFAGQLSNVMFYRRGFRCEAFPPNDMEDVDFSSATLRDVDFRGLDLERVILPVNARYLRVPNDAVTFRFLTEMMEARGDSGSASIAETLRAHRRWADSGQEHFSLNIGYLVEFGGTDAFEALRRALQKH
jgi:uncharacterized protein YjbI with pentapeptide repeats